MAVVAVLGILLGIFFLLINFLYRERRYSKTYPLLQQPSTVEQTALCSKSSGHFCLRRVRCQLNKIFD